MRRCWLLRPTASALGWVKGARSPMVRNDSHDLTNDRSLTRNSRFIEGTQSQSGCESALRADSVDGGHPRKQAAPIALVPLVFRGCSPSTAAQARLATAAAGGAFELVCPSVPDAFVYLCASVASL